MIVPQSEPIEQEQEDSEPQKSYSNVKVNPQVSTPPRVPVLMIEIDIWSCGVILLSFLSKRYPFFNSVDDTDAMIELASIFSKPHMRACARLHSP
jgi:serine/threonine protein kinase